MRELAGCNKRPTEAGRRRIVLARVERCTEWGERATTRGLEFAGEGVT